MRFRLRYTNLRNTSIQTTSYIWLNPHVGFFSKELFCLTRLPLCIFSSCTKAPTKFSRGRSIRKFPEHIVRITENERERALENCHLQSECWALSSSRGHHAVHVSFVLICLFGWLVFDFLKVPLSIPYWPGIHYAVQAMSYSSNRLQTSGPLPTSSVHIPSSNELSILCFRDLCGAHIVPTPRESVNVSGPPSLAGQEQECKEEGQEHRRRLESREALLERPARAERIRCSNGPTHSGFH